LLSMKFTRVQNEAKLLHSFITNSDNINNNNYNDYVKSTSNLETILDSQNISDMSNDDKRRVYNIVGEGFSTVILQPYYDSIYLTDMIQQKKSINITLLTNTMFSCLSELQKLGLCHNDIREDNILYDTDNDKFILTNFYYADKIATETQVTNAMEQYLPIGLLCLTSYSCLGSDDLFAFACAILHTVNKDFTTYQFSSTPKSGFDIIPCDVNETIINDDYDNDNDNETWDYIYPQQYKNFGYYRIVDVKNRCTDTLINYILKSRPSLEQAINYYDKTKTGIYYRLTCG